MIDARIREAFETREELSRTPDEKIAYESRLKTIIDAEARLADARSMGENEGKLETARNLLGSQTVLEDVVEHEAVEDDQHDETPDRVGEVLLDLHRHGEGDDEDEDRSRDEDLADREPGIDVVADVTALGALVAPGEVLLLTVHHSDARTVALLTLLLLGLSVRCLAILVDQGLAAQ